MTTRPQPRPAPKPMIEPFPIPGTHVRLAYFELDLAVNGTDEEREQAKNPAQMENPALLPRPWDPGSCLDPKLRHDLWQWLEEVVIWLNREYSWDVSETIPTCWPEHPHLVHEIAVVADRRRRAGLATTSDALEEWHRFCLPAFQDRMRARLKSHCDDDHARWPGRSRHNEHISQPDVEAREDTYANDVYALSAARRPGQGPELQAKTRFAVVDRDTGEIRDEYDGDE